MKILAIVGSLRKGSYNKQLALAAKEAVGSRAKFELLDYSDVPLFNEDIEFPAPDSVKRVRGQVKTAEAIWFFSPEYNHFFSGVLKNLIDWLSRETVDESESDLLSGKPTAISGASLGMGGTVTAQDHLVTLISFLDMDVMNYPRLTIPRVSKQADENGILKLTDSAPFLKEQANAFLAFIERHLNE